MKIKHYDLFAGIGGFSYALDTVFGEYEREHVFCEWEAFPTAVLKKHWPEATYYGDIADLVADTESTRAREDISGLRGLSERHNQRKRGQGDITIVTGGFPCQPFSHAGRRQGTSDDRYKWPEMFSVIRNVRPDWVIAENVRGLVTWNDGLVLETVCADLESEGYEVQPLIIPAVAVGAPHRRDRVWIVANADSVNRQCQPRNARVQRANVEAIQRGRQAPQFSNTGWSPDWREVAFATCNDGMDDGLPRRMDRVTISPARHRKERLKACGNAIVPQVAMQIFRAIKSI